MTTHYISRRRLLSVAAGGTALVLAGCGSAGLGALPGGTEGTAGSDPGTPGGAPPAPAPAPPPTIDGQTETVHAADVDGSLYTVDPLGHEVARLTGAGIVLWTTRAGELNLPRQVAVDSHGTVCIANHGDSNVCMYDAVGTRLGEVGGPGTEPGSFRFLPDIAFDKEDRLFAVDAHNHRIQVLDGDGTAVLTFGALGSEPGQLNGPRALAFDAEGNVHVLDAGNVRIQVFDPRGRALYEYGAYGTGAGQFLLPHDLAIDEHDRVYVTDPATRRVLVFEDAGYEVATALEPVDEVGDPVTPLRVSIGPQGGLLLSVRPIVPPATIPAPELAPSDA